MYPGRKHSSSTIHRVWPQLTRRRHKDEFFWFWDSWKTVHSWIAGVLTVYDRHFKNNNRKEGSYLIRLPSFLLWFFIISTIYSDLYVNKFIVVYFIGRIFEGGGKIKGNTSTGWARIFVFLYYFLFVELYSPGLYFLALWGVYILIWKRIWSVLNGQWLDSLSSLR